MPYWLLGDPAAQFHPTAARSDRPDLHHRNHLGILHFGFILAGSR